MAHKKLSRELLPGGLLVAVCFAAFLKEPRFFDPKSINSILMWMPLITVAAMGQLIVIVMRGIDISLGSIIGFSAIAVGLILRDQPALPIWLALLMGVGIGAVLGMINASLITWGRLSPIVVTIGTLTAFRGATFLLSRGEQIDPSMIPDSLTGLASHGLRIGGVVVSYLLLIALAVGAVTYLFLRFTQLGRDIFAFGSNPEAAHLRGISVKQITFLGYTLCGAAAGLTGVMYAGRFGFANPGTAGQNFELNVIAAVAIGGVKISGGYGTVFGVLMGCLLLSCINVALSVLGIGADWQMVTYGAIILIALTIDGLARSVRDRRMMLQGAQ